jgi:integrase
MKLPAVTSPQFEPWPVEWADAITEAMPDRYKALVVLAAQTGLRQGEVFGLTLPNLNMLKRRVKVSQALVLLPKGEPYLGPPKTEASRRTVPLPAVAVDALARHLAAYPPGPDGFVFTNENAQPIRRTRFGEVWRRAVVAAELPAGSHFHELRHHYASVLISGGESVTTVQERLGHKSATETLDTYSHLWPKSEDRTRAVVDAAWASRVTSRVTDTPREDKSAGHP